MAGYLPAAPSSDFTVPEFTGKRDQWWDRQFQAAEYQPDGAGYWNMPDDYAPKFTDGASLSGQRRTHRILYKGAGVARRMPSVTAIKRYSAETRSTSDVPVSAAFPGGAVTGTVRVTHNGAGRWSVSRNEFTPEQAAYVYEGVSAVLEARRPSTGLKQAGISSSVAGEVCGRRRPFQRDPAVVVHLRGRIRPLDGNHARPNRRPLLRVPGARGIVQPGARVKGPRDGV